MAAQLPRNDQVTARHAQMFPRLSAAQIARIAPLAKERALATDEIVFREGDSGVPMLVILEGAIEVTHPRTGVLVTLHEPGSFTGEFDQLSDRRALVQGRATMPGRALVVPRSALRTIVQVDPELSEILLRAFILRRMGLIAGQEGDAVVIGSHHSAETLRLQEFLTRNGHPYKYVDIDTDPHVQALLDGFHVGVSDVPVLICRGEKVLKNPSNVEVAECLGLNEPLEAGVIRDVVIVGAGPAGLAAAVYGASEGLDVLVLESTAPGGQAGSSSRIENYLGFPTGISGLELSQRAFTQAEKFGAHVAIARDVVRLNCDQIPYLLETREGEIIYAKTIVIASGAEYRKLDVPDLAKFEAVGIYYGATFVEAQRCATEEVIVVGGGNSAGQAATYLARSSPHVHVVIRSSGLAASMSRYLIRRIEDTPNITLYTHTQIVGVKGGDHLEEVTWRNDKTGEKTVRPIRHLFSMTGAKPNTEWLRGCLALDEKGFVLTGPDLRSNPDVAAKVAPSRTPYLFETSLPKVFAVGDVRAGSVKRVAASVGEGSACIQLVHKALAE